MTSAERITEAPDEFHAFTGTETFAGFACNYSNPYYGPTTVDDPPVCWVPLDGGEITQDGTGDDGETYPTGIFLTRDEVRARLNNLYDIAVTVLREDGSRDSERVWLGRDLAQADANRDGLWSTDDTFTSADDVVESTLNDWGVDVVDQFPHGYDAEWVEAKPGINS